MTHIVKITRVLQRFWTRHFDGRNRCNWAVGLFDAIEIQTCKIKDTFMFNLDDPWLHMIFNRSSRNFENQKYLSVRAFLTHV